MEAVIPEFDGAVGRSDYEAVNALLGVNPETGTGDWPSDLALHVAGAKPGGWVVIELWESRAAQDEFLSTRLGKALADAGVGAPARVGLAGPGLDLHPSLLNGPRRKREVIRACQAHRS